MSVTASETIIDTLQRQFGADAVLTQETRDGIPTFWTPRERVREVLGFLKAGVERPYRMLYDLTAIDERVRTNRAGQPPSDFTVIYTLLSFDRNAYVRIKTALREGALSVDTLTPVWPAANWYEREVWDMFGITFSGHPHLTRILMPKTWVG
ncbi:MAG TPA: NADH-quinone oxidoreductase subunit C, partial [Bryobacteraceae bacterium]|nr:NADH-quinone oxidoreductase subunit C [Bryobacteraceae bacterium]